MPVGFCIPRLFEEHTVLENIASTTCQMAVYLSCQDCTGDNNRHTTDDTLPCVRWKRNRVKSKTLQTQDNKNHQTLLVGTSKEASHFEDT
jgi:hypothetical protein